MVVFVVLISFLSAVLPLNMIGVFLVFPLLCLSFPFYAYISSVNLGSPHYWVDFYKVRFLTVDLTPACMHCDYATIPIFLLVNVVGVILGYGLSRIPRIREFGNNRIWKLAGFILGSTFLMIGRWLIASNSRIVDNGRIVRPEGLYYIDGNAIFYFGIIILLIAIGKILWRYKDQLLEEFYKNIEIKVKMKSNKMKQNTTQLFFFFVTHFS
jgi:hypothetical protein